MTEAHNRPPTSYDQYGLNDSLDGDYDLASSDAFAFSSFGSHAFPTQQRFPPNTGLASDTGMQGLEMEHAQSHQYLLVPMSEQLTVRREAAMGCFGSKPQADKDLHSNDYSGSSIEPGSAAGQHVRLNSSDDYGLQGNEAFRSNSLDTHMDLSSGIASEWMSMPTISEQHGNEDLAGYWGLNMSNNGRTGVLAASTDGIGQLPRTALLMLFVTTMRLDKARRSLQRVITTPSSEHSSYPTGDRFDEPMRHVLDFCKAMMPVLSALPENHVTQQSHTANETGFHQLFQVASFSIMACNAALEIQNAILAQSSSSVSKSDQPDDVRQPLPSPAPSRHSSLAQSPSLSAGTSFHSTAPGQTPTRQGSMNVSQISLPSRRPSVPLLPSPDGQRQSQPERAPALHSPVTQLVQLDTIEFHLTHLLAICKRLQEAIGQLSSRQAGDENVVGSEDEGSEFSAAAELVKENQAVIEQIEAVQREVVERSRRLKEQELA